MSSAPVQSAPASDLLLNDFAELVAGMSRFLARLSGISVFTTAGLGLSEWVALSVLSQNEGISAKQLAAKLGVTGQRVNQITSGLISAGLIISTVSKEDSRKHELRVSAAGKRELQSLNRQLRPLIEAAFPKREQAISRLAKRTKSLMRIVGKAKKGAEQTEGGKD